MLQWLVLRYLSSGTVPLTEDSTSFSPPGACWGFSFWSAVPSSNMVALSHETYLPLAFLLKYFRNISIAAARITKTTHASKTIIPAMALAGLCTTVGTNPGQFPSTRKTGRKRGKGQQGAKNTEMASPYLQLRNSLVLDY